MAGTSGLDLVEILRTDERWRDVKVVMTSGFADEFDLRARSSDEGIPFFPKPVELDALARVIDASLRSA
jgi:CheY-like chemotaxis protein